MGTPEKNTITIEEIEAAIKELGPRDIKSYYDVKRGWTIKAVKFTRRMLNAVIDTQNLKKIAEKIDEQMILRILELMQAGHFPSLIKEAESQDAKSFISDLVHQNKNRLKALLE